MLLVLLLFLGIAGVLLQNAQNPELVRINLVAQQYGDAWRDGTLASLEFDRLSWPDVGKGDAKRIAANVDWITRWLGDPKSNSGPGPHPTSVEVDHTVTSVRTSDPTLADVTLQVTWTLQRSGLSQTGQIWSYPVKLTERNSGGRWRVVWNPSAVHPKIVHGLVLIRNRALAPRATVIGAGDTPLPPAGKPGLARGLLGSMITSATHEQSELAALRATAGDTMGVQGLESEFDQQLAGGASIEVDAVRDPRYANLPEVTGPLFVGPPDTPSPVKVSLDARTQGWVEQALTSVKQPTTLLVVKPSTGELLGVAKGGPNAKTQINSGQDPGLLSQAPPGPMFGMAAALALLRAGNSQNTLNTRLDCSSPWTYSGNYKGDYQSQVFRNPPGAPDIPGVTLGAAVEGAGATCFARAASSVTPQA
ncbi:MAG TPA: NTF2-like N-terminal transpeptidase domain-containing protein, partial [Kineosporiaceae bacterium]|nr:NTF2-like N-terminal transpeptidase domain-containing protein [Kineosporiaceae bacterium]